MKQQNSTNNTPKTSSSGGIPSKQTHNSSGQQSIFDFPSPSESESYESTTYDSSSEALAHKSDDDLDALDDGVGLFTPSEIVKTKQSAWPLTLNELSAHDHEFKVGVCLSLYSCIYYPSTTEAVHSITMNMAKTIMERHERGEVLTLFSTLARLLKLDSILEDTPQENKTEVVQPHPSQATTIQKLLAGQSQPPVKPVAKKEVNIPKKQRNDKKQPFEAFVEIPLQQDFSEIFEDITDKAKFSAMFDDITPISTKKEHKQRDRSVRVITKETLGHNPFKSDKLSSDVKLATIIASQKKTGFASTEPSSVHHAWFKDKKKEINDFCDKLKNDCTPFQALALNMALHLAKDKGFSQIDLSVDTLKKDEPVKDEKHIKNKMKKSFAKQGLDIEDATPTERRNMRAKLMQEARVKQKEAEDLYFERLVEDNVGAPLNKRVDIAVQCAILRQGPASRHMEKLGMGQLYAELRSKAPAGSSNLLVHSLPFIGSDRVLSNTPLLTICQIFWLYSRKEMNKAIHALNGNTDFIDSDMNVSKFTIVATTVQANVPLYVNNTPYSVKWKKATYSVVVTGAGLVPETYWSAIQTVAPGSTPLTLQTASKINSVHARMWPIRTFTISTTYAAGLLGSSPTFEDQFIIVPPGYTLMWTVVCTQLTSAALLTINLGLQSANYRPFPEAETAYSLLDVNVYLPGAAKSTPMQVSSIDDVYDVLLKNYRLSRSHCSLRTRVGARIQNVSNNQDIYINLKMVGGMDTLTEAATEEKIGKSAAITDYSEVKQTPAKTEAKIPDNLQPLFDLLKRSLDGGNDNFFGTTINDRQTLLQAWATAQRPMPVLVNQQMSRVYNDWYEGVTSTNSAFIDDELVIVDSYDIIHASKGTTPAIALSKPFAALNTAIRSGETVTMSQYIRINTSLANGDAMNRALLTSAAKYTTGQAGSMARVLLQFYLYTLGMVPLYGIEQYSVANLHYKMNPAHTYPGAALFPYSPVGTTQIFAKFIDTNVFAGLEAGMVQVAFPPVGWQLQDIGNSVALVPLDYSMLNQPALIAAWTLGFLEYPFRTSTGQMSTVDDHNQGLGVDIDTYPHASRTRIPGITQKVLYVVTNLFASGQNDIQMLVGGLGAPIALNLQTNGLNGVAVDIVPALDDFFNSNSMLTSFSIACDIWHKFLGNAEDYYAANLAAACAHVSLGTLPTRLGHTVNGFLYKQGTPAGHVDPVWNTAGYADVTLDDFDRITTSRTKPDCPRVHTFAELVEGMTGLRVIGAIDYISAVHKVWGFYDYVNKAPSVANSASAVTARMRFTAKYVTTIFDEIYRMFGDDNLPLMTMGIQPDMSSGLAREVQVRVYQVWKKCFLDKIQLGMSLDYRVDNLGLLVNPIYNYIGIALPGMMSAMRKPRSERANYMSDDNDRSWIMKKATTNYSVMRIQDIGDGPFIEVFRTNAGFDNKSLTLAMQQLFSTQWVQGSTALQNRVNLGMYYTNNTNSITSPFHVRVCHPSTSIGILISLDNVNGGPDLGTALNITDVPTLDIPPVWSTLWNQGVYLKITSSSPYFARFTRHDQTDYFMKVLPDNTTYQTVQLTSDEPNNMRQLGGAFGLDF